MPDPCAASCRLPDYRRDRCCCRSAGRRCPVADERDFHITGQDFQPLNNSVSIIADISNWQNPVAVTETIPQKLIPCSALDTAVQVNICVCGHRFDVPRRLPDYSRDRCCCRTARRLYPVAHRQDIHIYRQRPLTVYIFCIQNRPCCWLNKSCSGNWNRLSDKKCVFSPGYSDRGEYRCRCPSLYCSRTGTWLLPGS